jgi:hypothetical protein
MVMKRILLCLILVTGCATTHKQTLPIDPIRNVAALVVYDTSYSRADVEQCLERSNSTFLSEFGIRIELVEVREYEWTRSDNTDHLLAQMHKLNQDGQYDMVIGFTRRTVLASVTDNLLAGWSGVIDDIWRRYVVVKSTDDYILTHELLHAFVFNTGHEWKFGQLSAIQVSLVPFLPFTSLRSSTISDAVYREVMKNKWRNFSQKISYH